MQQIELARGQLGYLGNELGTGLLAISSPRTLSRGWKSARLSYLPDSAIVTLN